MRKLKDLSFNEKLLLVMALLSVVAILLNWPKVKDGFVKGWRHFGVELEK